MQTKRLTLDEYRKVNAVWLSNQYYRNENTGKSHNERICFPYLTYLLCYGGLTDEVHEAILSKIYECDKNDRTEITSADIEAIIADEVKHEMD